MKTTSKNKGNGIDADVSGNRLPFKSHSINNFCGINISQPTPSESLSVPLFSLEYQLPNIKRMSTLEATKELLNSENYFVNIQLMRFILSCLNLRNNSLSSQTDVTYLFITILFLFVELYAFAIL